MRRKRIKVLPVIVALQAVFLLAPLLVVAVYSFSGKDGFSLSPGELSLQWYRDLLSSPKWVQPLRTSVLVGVAAAAFSVIIGLLAAVAMVRHVRRGKAVLRLLLLLPLIVPTVITGMALLAAFQGTPFLFSIQGVVIAHVVLTIPYAVFLLEMQLSQLNPDLEQAAQSLGATRLQAFARVTLPILVPAVITAAVFVFYNSWEEVVVTSFVAGAGTKTLPVEMFLAVQNQISPVIAALSTLLMVATVGLGWLYLGVTRRVSGWRRRAAGSVSPQHDPGGAGSTVTSKVEEVV